MLRSLTSVVRQSGSPAHTQALTNDLGSGRASGAGKGTARMAVVLKINPGFDASYPWREIGTSMMVSEPNGTEYQLARYTSGQTTNINWMQNMTSARVSGRSGRERVNDRCQNSPPDMMPKRPTRRPDMVPI